jgi:PAS domain S-box-containing protein
LLLGLAVLARERMSLVSASFFVMTLTISIWLFCFSIVYSTTNEQVALWWMKASYLGVPLIAPATYQFAITVLRLYRRYRYYVWAAWLVSTAWSAIAVTTDWLFGDTYRFWWGYYPRFGWVGLLFIGCFFTLLIANMVYFRHEYQAAPPGTHKQRVKWFMMAFAIGYIGAVDFVACYGLPIYPFGYAAIAGFLVVAARTIWLYRLVDITPAFAAKQITDTMTDALLVLDHSGVIRVVNPAATQLLGYSKKELLGRRVAEVIGDPLFSGRAEQLIRNGTISNYEVTHRQPGGAERVLSFSTSVMQSSDRQPTAIVCIARDITERKQAERDMLEKEQRYRAVVEQTSEGICLADAHTMRFLEANSALLNMLGYDADELRNLTVYDVVDCDPQSIQRDVQRILELGSYTSDEQQLRRKDGSMLSVELSINTIVHGGKQVLCAVIHDITERKRAEERIKRQLDQLAALRSIDIAITASHDLRVTLGVILDQVTSQLQVDAASVLLLNPHTQTLEYAAGRGFRTGAITRTSLRLGQGHAGRAAMECHSIFVPDLAAAGDRARATLSVGEGFISYYVAPLIARGQIKGVMEVLHRSPLHPQSDWLDFAEALAGQAAIAVDNASMFQDLQRKHIELALAYDITLEGWSRALDLRDHETEGHTRRVTDMTVRLAREIGVTEADLIHVYRGALLHDIGKMAIPDSILLKPGPLTEEEWQVMRMHPVYAYELLSPIEFLRPALDIPYCHHERWDGSGYPRGLKGEQIPLPARIFMVVDVWDALRSDRPYRKAWPEKRVRDFLLTMSGKHFEPRAVEAFMDIVDAGLAEENLMQAVSDASPTYPAREVLESYRT